MIELTQMSMTDTERYRTYKMKKLKSNGMKLNAMSIFTGVFASIVYYITQGKVCKTWFILGIWAFAIFSVVYFVYYFKRECKKIEDASGVPYEYAMIEMKYDEELQFMCSDGQVICQTYKSGDNSASNEGKERVFIYVPKYDLRFIEDVNDK